MALLFSNKIAQNRHRLFSNKWLPKGVAYSAIKDHQIAIALISNKRALNPHCLFSDKNSPKLPSNYLATLERHIVSDNLAMLVTSCWRHQAKTRGYGLCTVLHLLKTY
jgi:hypothetical protein